MNDLFSNQFFRGGLVLMLTGAVMGLLRQAPGQLYVWVKRRFTVSVLITDRDPLFEWAKLWLDSLPYSKRARNVTCSLFRENDEEFSAQSQLIFNPAYGMHFFRHGKRLIWLERNKPENTSPGGNNKTRTGDAPETLSLTILSTDQSAIRELVKEIAAYAAADEKRRVRGYISTCGWWRRLVTFQARSIDTVDLPREDQIKISFAIEEFLGARALYGKRGIPYHLNFLFAGLPGTGKTSIASALCGHFGLNLHLLNIAGPGMNDERLVELMLSLPRRSMVLMEDVDAIVPERKSKPKSPAPTTGEVAAPDGPEGVTLSGLLNCMDGITAPDGAVIVMTTNHPEALDPALLRPGRVDMRIDFGPATREQIERMCNRLNPNRKLNGAIDAMLLQKYTTAQVQSAILAEYKGDSK